MAEKFLIRRATGDDLELISHHRARMFQDMRELPEAMFQSFLLQAHKKLQQMFDRGDYVGWLASPTNESERVVAGAGVQLREVPPHPVSRPNGKVDIISGRQAIVQNVFTEAGWRRQGLAALLISTIIDWCRNERIKSIVLHSSDQGRSLYERLGFVATTEMSLEPF